MKNKKYYMGIDIGSISTKGVIIDEDENIVASKYLWTEGGPIEASKMVVKSMVDECKNKGVDLEIYGIGTTGSARNLIGKILGASVIKNEITAHGIGTLSRYKDARTILEIGGQDSKLIIIKDGVIVDYAMNTLCAAGTGAFLSSQAKRLGLEIEELGQLALQSKNPSKIAARCTVFAESDLVHKAQIGHSKEDIVAGICNAVATNFLNNLGKGKKIEDKVIFQGGVSKNVGVVRAFEKALNKKVYVDENSHLMGALGIAIIAKKNSSSNYKTDFDYNIDRYKFKTIGAECRKCSNNCELVYIYKDNELIDIIGGRCPNGQIIRKNVV